MDCCWSWNSSTLATWCEELTPWKRPWCWERLKAGGEGDDRGWDGWMASPSRWTWVGASSGSWWWIGKHGVLQSMGLQRVRHNWATELSWIFHCLYIPHLLYPPVSRHLGCSHVLATVNSDAVNTGVHASYWIRVYSGYMPRNGIVESYDNSLINLLFLSLSLSLVFHNLSISVKSTFKFGEYRGQISLKTFFKFCLFTVNLFFLSKMYLCCPFLFKALFL